MKATKSLLFLAIVGYTFVSGAVIKKNLAQSDCPILSGQGPSSSTLVSTAAAVEADTSSSTQSINNIECSSEANSEEFESENGSEVATGCEAAKRLYLFGGAFDYLDVVSTTETGAKQSLSTASGVATATATSSLTSASSGALPTGVCVSTCSGASFPSVPAAAV
jgi:hypothetical protein